jgi:hypothetical protein
MIGDLYADGVMQQTEDFRFTVLQGSCIGGSTTVNNAVCFAPPERVLATWNDPKIHDAGLNLEDLGQSVQAVSSFLCVSRQSETHLNPSASKYVEGAQRLGLSPDALEVDVVRANIAGCYGCGYCNIGCRWGKKLSMLETALPWAQRDFQGRVRIIAECEVERIRTLSGQPKRVANNLEPGSAMVARSLFRHASTSSVPGRSDRAICCCVAAPAAGSPLGRSSASTWVLRLRLNSTSR